MIQGEYVTFMKISQYFKQVPPRIFCHPTFGIMLLIPTQCKSFPVDPRGKEHRGNAEKREIHRTMNVVISFAEKIRINYRCRELNS